MNTSPAILVVEDHDSLRMVTVDYLREQGHAAEGIASAEMLQGRADLEQVGIYILDLNLPGEDGISLARRLRQARPDSGIIMLTARNTEQDKVSGYDGGADIYLTKPTSVIELNAAIQALKRRLPSSPPPMQALQLDLQALTLSGALARITLSSNEALLLASFIKAKGQQLQTWQIIELQEQDESAEYNKAALEVRIVRLRKKLMAAGGAERSIIALRGWGYQLCIELRQV